MTTATKAASVKATFKPTMTVKQLDTAILSVINRSTELQDDIHDVAVAIMLHTYAHGDYTRAKALVDGLGRGIRAKALVEWFHKAGLDVDATKGFTGFNKSVMVKNWDFCKANRWYTMKPENAFAGFDLDAEIAKLLKRAEKAISTDSQTAEADRAEGYAMNVRAEQLAALRKLAGVTLQ